MKTKVIIIALSILILTGCTKTEEKYVAYSYRDENVVDVALSVEHPQSWTPIEQKAEEGDENKEASIESCIYFDFSKAQQETEGLVIGAMLFTQMSFDETYEQSTLTLPDDKEAQVYTLADDERTAVFYTYNSTAPYYFIAVNMSTEVYEKYKDDIEKVATSLTFDTLAD